MNTPPEIPAEQVNEKIDSLCSQLSAVFELSLSEFSASDLSNLIGTALNMSQTLQKILNTTQPRT
ncbi:hypothetical protein [Yersinia intermedia]|uniref:hypothetical protein n=1 Tax=Yersinia intermedia TaxID=631 RepID=UPI0011A30D6A|nr:hypothetical protein [Yersinia intermedia]